MSIIKSYAAKEAGSELELYEYDAGELKPEDVDRQRMGLLSISAGCRA